MIEVDLELYCRCDELIHLSPFYKLKLLGGQKCQKEKRKICNFIGCHAGRLCLVNDVSRDVLHVWW